MDSAKKQHERFLLDRFLELQGISPACIEARESPDFLIDLEGRKVGIEVTELFIRTNRSEAHPQPEIGPLLQAAESNQDKIVSRAREIYFDSGNPLLKSTIWFSDGITLDKKKGDQIAELIADRIHRMSLQGSSAVAWRSSEAENEECSLSEWVDMIHTHRVPEYRDAQWKDRFAWWQVARPGLVAPLTPKRLQEVIENKAKKIGVYRKVAEQIWLLIFVDRTQPSQMFSVAPGFPLDSVSSPFTRTFYCDYVAKEVMELAKKVERSTVIL